MQGTFTRREVLRLFGISLLLLNHVISVQEKKTATITLEHLDRAWFRKMLTEETGHWLKAAATPSRFFQVNLDRRW